MRNVVQAVVLSCAGLVLSGCITPQSYVDPAYRKATLDSVVKSESPIPAKVQVEFQRNGEHFPKVDKQLRMLVEKTLAKSSVLTPSQDGAAVFSVRANNIADLDAARSKGFKTGLTFGGSGSMIDDNYEFKCSYTNQSGMKREMNYQHAIHTSIGKVKEKPAGLTPTSPNEAFGQVVDDVILNCLMNLQLAETL